jgi:hypothetical protein
MVIPVNPDCSMFLKVPAFRSLRLSLFHAVPCHASRYGSKRKYGTDIHALSLIEERGLFIWLNFPNGKRLKTR